MVAFSTIEPSDTTSYTAKNTYGAKLMFDVTSSQLMCSISAKIGSASTRLSSSSISATSPQHHAKWRRIKASMLDNTSGCMAVDVPVRGNDDDDEDGSDNGIESPPDTEPRRPCTLLWSRPSSRIKTSQKSISRPTDTE